MITYATVHARLASERGPAALHPCAICGRRAREWAYRGPRVGGERLPFSTDLRTYEPLCRLCHGAFDRLERRVADRHPGDVTLW